MPEKLTKKFIDGLTYEGENGKKDIRWDADMPGFGIRVYPSGKKAFVLSYRDKGKKHLFTIAKYGKVTLDQAREIAKKKFGAVADDKNPLKERQEARKRHEWTVRRAFGDFLRRHAKVKTKNWKEAERIFEKDVLPSIGTWPIDEVTKADILKILDKVEDRGAGVMSNRTLAHIRKFFNWCVERDLISFSPAFKIAAPAANPKRDRTLAEHEIRYVWEASLGVGYPFGDITRFLLLTGQRRGEAANMRWQDYDAEKKIWTIPKEFSKNNKEHIIPLSDAAAEIIESVPNMGAYIFTSTGKKPFENFSRDKIILDQKINAKRRERKLMKMADWRIHDLRRTTASGMAQLKVQPHIIERVLNHTGGIISGVAAVYNRYQYAPEMRAALEEWATQIESILSSRAEKV
jgi:integrase